MTAAAAVPVAAAAVTAVAPAATGAAAQTAGLGPTLSTSWSAVTSTSAVSLWRFQQLLHHCHGNVAVFAFLGGAAEQQTWRC